MINYKLKLFSFGIVNSLNFLLITAILILAFIYTPIINEFTGYSILLTIIICVLLIPVIFIRDYFKLKKLYLFFEQKSNLRFVNFALPFLGLVIFVIGVIIIIIYMSNNNINFSILYLISIMYGVYLLYKPVVNNVILKQNLNVLYICFCFILTFFISIYTTTIIYGEGISTDLQFNYILYLSIFIYCTIESISLIINPIIIFLKFNNKNNLEKN